MVVSYVPVCLKVADCGIDLRKEMKEKLLSFLDTTQRYETDRLFGILPSDGEQMA